MQESRLGDGADPFNRLQYGHWDHAVEANERGGFGAYIGLPAPEREGSDVYAQLTQG